MHTYRIKLPRSDRLFYISIYTIIILLTVSVMYPIIYVISSSFSSGTAVSTGQVVLFPVDLTLAGYKQVFQYQQVWIGYRNTIFYTVAGTINNVFVTLICAYPLARKDLPGRKYFMFLYVFTMYFSGGMIPSYLLMLSIGYINTIWAMILPGAFGVYQMIVCRTFIQSTIPVDMLEAAKIDGCSDAQYFRMFILPLSKAIIAVMALQYAIGHWNSYFSAFIYLTNKNLYPLQLFLREILIMNQMAASDFMDEETRIVMQGMADLIRYALIVVATAPIMCFYPFIQKYFVQGIMIGSLKG